VMTWMPRKEGAKSGERHSLSTREPIGCACTNRHALSGAPLFFSGDFGCEGNKISFVFLRKIRIRAGKKFPVFAKKKIRVCLLAHTQLFFCSSRDIPNSIFFSNSSLRNPHSYTIKSG
jgi:hypothetical protein